MQKHEAFLHAEFSIIRIPLTWWLMMSFISGIFNWNLESSGLHSVALHKSPLINLADCSVKLISHSHNESQAIHFHIINGSPINLIYEITRRSREHSSLLSRFSSWLKLHYFYYYLLPCDFYHILRCHGLSTITAKGLTSIKLLASSAFIFLNAKVSSTCQTYFLYFFNISRCFVAIFLLCKYVQSKLQTCHRLGAYKIWRYWLVFHRYILRNQ